MVGINGRGLETSECPFSAATRPEAVRVSARAAAGPRRVRRVRVDASLAECPALRHRRVGRAAARQRVEVLRIRRAGEADALRRSRAGHHHDGNGHDRDRPPCCPSESSHPCLPRSRLPCGSIDVRRARRPVPRAIQATTHSTAQQSGDHTRPSSHSRGSCPLMWRQIGRSRCHAARRQVGVRRTHPKRRQTSATDANAASHRSPAQVSLRAPPANSTGRGSTPARRLRG